MLRPIDNGKKTLPENTIIYSLRIDNFLDYYRQEYWLYMLHKQKSGKKFQQGMT